MTVPAHQIRADHPLTDLTTWHNELDRIRKSFPLGYTRPSTGAAR